MTKYVMVSWPEIQDFMDNERWNECIFCHEIENHPCPDSTYMVPEDLYEEVMYKLQFPKTYRDTNIGTVVCYETRAVVNGEDTYWYDEDLIKKGLDVLIYNHDLKDHPEWIISKCVAASTGLPFIFENRFLLPGMNCEIVGVKTN